VGAWQRSGNRHGAFLVHPTLFIDGKKHLSRATDAPDTTAGRIGNIATADALVSDTKQETTINL
jgi:hypothetical protein